MAFGAGVLTIFSVFAVRANKKFAGVLTVYYNKNNTFRLAWVASGKTNNPMVTTSITMHGIAKLLSSSGSVTLVTKTNHTPLYSRY